MRKYEKPVVLSVRDRARNAANNTGLPKETAEIFESGYVEGAIQTALTYKQLLHEVITQAAFCHSLPTQELNRLAAQANRDLEGFQGV